MNEPNKKLDQLAHDVIGAAIEVHRVLGPGFLETVYEEALCVELASRLIPFTTQVPVTVSYKGRTVGNTRLDLMVCNCLIVELKTVETITALHSAQLISYLKATRLELGLLINFNTPLLRDGISRIVLTR